jgi:cytochrome c-type biogenesis protein CcmH
MTDGTLLIACLMLAVLAALLFLLPPRRQLSLQDRQRILTELYRQRQQELGKEIELAGADEGTATELRHELDAALLDDVALLGDAPPAEQSPAPAVDNARWPSWVLAVSLPLLAGYIYLQVGDPTADALREARTVLTLANDDPALERWLDVLEARIDARPTDAESTYLYGHVLLKQERFARAAEAFAKAHELVGDDVAIESYWLQARYLAAKGEVDEQSVKIAERILERDPGNVPVLQLLSVHHAREGDFKASLQLLNRALGVVRDDDSRATLLAFMEQIRVHVPAELPAIEVKVQSAAGAPAQATVFVIARPVGGGVPFAVERRPVTMLPFQVRLDDLASMNPANLLSAAEQVEVVVRLSLSGQPTAAPGDWEWRSNPVQIEGMQQLAELEAFLSPPAIAPAQGIKAEKT